MTRQLIYHNVIYHQDLNADQLCINLFSNKQYEGWSILGFTVFEKLTENSFAEIVDGTQNPVKKNIWFIIPKLALLQIY